MHSRLLGGIAGAVSILVTLTACGSGNGAQSTGSSKTTFSGSPTKVLVVMEENHSYTQMREGMPFLADLSDKYGYAKNWKALAHPSEPNYLGIVAGSTFGIRDDHPPAVHHDEVGSATTVFDQALAEGKRAATYAESMPQPCHLTDYAVPPKKKPTYAVRHNPWVYFPSSRDNCLVNDQDLTSFADDAVRNDLPNVGFLIPNMDNDAHDGSLSTADTWLSEQLAPVLKSADFTSGRLVVVVTADEDDSKSGNVVLTSVLTPRLDHKVVNTTLTHYSLTRYIAHVLDVKPLGKGADAPDMKAAFGL